MSRTHRIVHETTYRYSDVVSSCYGRAWLQPRELDGQHVHTHSLVVDPAPVDLSTGRDVHGNETTYYQVARPSTQLVVRGESLVSVETPVHDPAATALPWERARPGGVPGRTAQDFVLDQLTPEVAEGVRAWAGATFAPRRPVGEVVDELLHRIHTDFAYRSGSTSVRTTLAEVLERREGVCQDFARLAVASLRVHGLAGRYVSGYLATAPPPGRERVVGADATHAWAALRLPSGSWLGFDPTNDHRTDDRYTTLAWGRDYHDVPPLRGIVYTDAATSTMTVSVDVAPAEPPGVSRATRGGPTGAAPGPRRTVARPSGPTRTTENQEPDPRA